MRGGRNDFIRFFASGADIGEIAEGSSERLQPLPHSSSPPLLLHQSFPPVVMTRSTLSPSSVLGNPHSTEAIGRPGRTAEFLLVSRYYYCIHTLSAEHHHHHHTLHHQCALLYKPDLQTCPSRTDINEDRGYISQTLTGQTTQRDTPHLSPLHVYHHIFNLNNIYPLR